VLWLIWLLIGGLLVLAELQTGTFYFLLLGAAAAAAGLLALLGISPAIQCLLFALLTLLSYAFVLPRFKKHAVPGSRVPTTAESLPGRIGIVETPIAPGETGQVKVNGELWSAVSDEALSPGDKVTVVEVRVTKLVVKKGDHPS
jgi:membrane protein implicated in regulation of membrane protease activity